MEKLPDEELAARRRHPARVLSIGLEPRFIDQVFEMLALAGTGDELLGNPEVGRLFLGG